MTELKPCPACGGEAYLEEDTDGSIHLKVIHIDTCPMCIDSASTIWSYWFYEESFDLEKGSVEEQVAEWWNRRIDDTD